MYLTSHDGVRLFFDDRGNGEPVVMIHGAAGSGMSFDPLVACLNDDFRLITVDLRGLSRSDRVDEVSSTAWCDDTLEVASFLGLGAFHLVGCSLGARVAARIAYDYPGRIVSLAVDAPLLSVAQGANSSLNRRFEDLDSPAAEDLEKWRRYHGEDWQTAVRFYGRVRNQPDLQERLTIRHWLSELTTPTLISRGDVDDAIHPLAHAVEWHIAHPTSWLWIEPGTRFSLTQRQPERYAEVYRKFIASLERN